MKNVLQKNILAYILFSYGIVGVLWQLEFLNIHVWKTANAQVVKTKSGPQLPAKYYWARHKHIPPSVKTSIPSSAELSPQMSRVCPCGTVHFQEAYIIQLDALSSHYSSRAPPQS